MIHNDRYSLETSEAGAPGRPPGQLIRATRIDDFEALSALMNLPGVRAGTLRLPYQRPEQMKTKLESQSPDTFNIVAVINGDIIGQASLHPYSGRRAHAAEVGIAVHDDHVGKGVGTTLMRELTDAADNWLGFKRLELTVYTDNDTAIKLYGKFGFEREGIHRHFALKAGIYSDVLSMARLRL